MSPATVHLGNCEDTSEDTSEVGRPKFIQLNLMDSIFEWDVLGNKIYLSKGACSQLSLGDKQCLTVEEFTAHSPRDEQLDTITSISNFLRGAGGPTICFSHSFDGVRVTTHMTVVDRKRDGMVTYAIGSIHVHSALASDAPLAEGDTSPGFWRLKPLEQTMRYGRRAMELLGSKRPAITDLTFNQLLSNLHPEDAVRVMTHYDLLLREGRWEGDVNDSFRFRIAGGNYRRFVIHGTVVERDGQGRVVEMIGTMQVVPKQKIVGCVENEIESESFFSAIAASEDGLWDWSVPDNQFRCSPRYLSMLGYTREEFPARFDKVQELVHPEDLGKYDPILQRVVQSGDFGKSFEFTCRMRKANGEYAWLLVRAYITHRDETGRAVRVVGLNTDISGTQKGWACVEAQIRNDELTDLRSRAFLNMEIQRIEKAGVRPVSVIILDLDGLKIVNDYLGHPEGDRLLREFALLMRRVFRSTDCVARVGGDEFTVILPACTEENARSLVSLLRRELEKYNAGSDKSPLLASIGVGSAETAESTLAQAIADADSEMLHSKHKRHPETLRSLKEFVRNSQNVVVHLDKSRYF